MPKRVDFSLNFSVEDIPDNVDVDNITVFGGLLMEDSNGFSREIRAENHTLEIWGEED